MTTHAFILFPSPTTWRLRATGKPESAPIDVRVQQNATPNDIAVAVAASLQSAGYQGEGVLLAIPSAWCLCAAIATTGLPPRNRHQAMAYRLEDKLPVAAEDVVADFLSVATSDVETLGVCAQKSVLAPIVDVLESNGIAVAAICPAALFALQQMLESGPPELNSADAIVWTSDKGDQLELFVRRDKKVHAWYVVPDEPRDLLLYLAMEFRTAGTSHSIAAVDVRPEIRSALSARPGLCVLDVTSLPWLAAATSLAGSILSGKVEPWINLRRDDLAVREPFRQIRTPLTCAVVAALICLLCACGGMLWRANRYDQMTARHADEQQAVFHQAFPNTAAPGDVHSRLAAEERGLHGLSGDASAPAPRETGLVTLRDLLTHLPGGDELRYRVLELRLDQSRFTLEGQAAAHGDADLIVASLRRGGVFVVEPPRTEQLGASAGATDAGDKSETAAKGVAFTITGAVVPGAHRPAPSRIGVLLPLPVLRQRAGVRDVSIHIAGEDPHPNPLPEYQERQNRPNASALSLRQNESEPLPQTQDTALARRETK